MLVARQYQIHLANWTDARFIGRYLQVHWAEILRLGLLFCVFSVLWAVSVLLHATMKLMLTMSRIRIIFISSVEWTKASVRVFFVENADSLFFLTCVDSSLLRSSSIQRLSKSVSSMVIADERRKKRKERRYYSPSPSIMRSLAASIICSSCAITNSSSFIANAFVRFVEYHLCLSDSLGFDANKPFNTCL